MTIAALRPVATDTDTEDAASSDGPGDRVYPVPRDVDFIIEKPNGAVRVAAFLFGGDIERIAERLIRQHHQFRHLEEATIVYRWKLKGGGSGGAVTLGACQKLGGLAQHALEADFCIWLAADNVREAGLTVRQVEALVFHELCHAGQTDKGGWCLINHDFTGFVAEVAEYGFWLPPLRSLEILATQRQLNLFEDAEPAG